MRRTTHSLIRVRSMSMLSYRAVQRATAAPALLQQRRGARLGGMRASPPAASAGEVSELTITQPDDWCAARAERGHA